MSGVLTTILLESNATEAETRRNAERQLIEAQNANFPEFLNLLSEELRVEGRPETSRQLAGLALKNAISGPSKRMDRIARERWLLLSPEIRDPIKQRVVDTLHSPSAGPRGAACQLVAKIARVEIPGDSWANLLPSLLDMVTGEASDKETRRTALTALGYVCEDVQLLVMETGSSLLPTEASNKILTTIIAGMQNSEMDVRLAAARALYHCLLFARTNMDSESERNFIFKVLTDNLSSSLQLLRVAVWECILQVASEYYEYLAPFMDILGRISWETVKEGSDQTAIPAMEFWNTICDEEILISLGVSENRSSHFIHQALPHLLPILFDVMTKQESEDTGVDEWTLAMAAGTCVGLCAQVVKDEILPPALSFVNENFQNPDWRKREAAVLAYGSILEGPSSHQLAGLLDQSFSRVCTLLSDSSVAVRDTTAWTIGRIAQFHPSCISNYLGDHSNRGLIALLSENLGDVPRVAGQICFSLTAVATAVRELSARSRTNAPSHVPPTSPLDPFFKPLVERLVQTAQRPDANEANLRVLAYTALSDLVLTVYGEENKLAMTTLATQLIEWLEKSMSMAVDETISSIQAHICGVLSVIIYKLETRVGPLAEKLFTLFTAVIDKHFDREGGAVQDDATEEAVNAIDALARALKLSFIPYLPIFCKTLEAGLSNSEDSQFCSKCIEIVGDLSRHVGTSFHPYCQPLLTKLYDLLRDPNVVTSIKPKIMYAIGDVAMNIGVPVLSYVDPFLQLIFQATGTRLEHGPADNEEWVAYIRELRNGVFSAYSGILYGLSDARQLNHLKPQVDNLVGFVQLVVEDPISSPENLSAAMDISSDLVVAYQREVASHFLKAPFVQNMIGKATDSNDPALLEKAEFLNQELRKFM